MVRQRSFTSYVADRFYNELFAAISDFAEENSDDLNLRLYQVNRIGGIELSDITIKYVSVNDLPGSEIEFEVAIEAEFNVREADYHYDTSTNSPAFNTFLAAQVNMNCNSLFMHGTMISDLISISGDVHHIFPKAYLKRNEVEAKGRYNQVANYTYLDTQVNKAVRDDAPNIYFGKVIEQCENGNIAFGNISDKGTMMKNLEENAIPYDVVEMTIDDYDRFLEERRFLMAKLVERYYKSL